MKLMADCRILLFVVPDMLDDDDTFPNKIVRIIIIQKLCCGILHG